MIYCPSEPSQLLSGLLASAVSWQWCGGRCRLLPRPLSDGLLPHRLRFLWSSLLAAIRATMRAFTRSPRTNSLYGRQISRFDAT